jgi:hypothetical protein
MLRDTVKLKSATRAEKGSGEVASFIPFDVSGILKS